MTRTLHIARVESELGALTDGEAVEMLRAGFLSPTDLYRAEGAAEWKPLSELTTALAVKPTSAMELTRQKLAAAGGAAISHAAQFRQKLKQATVRQTAQLTDSASRMLDSYTPQIQNLVAVQLASRSLTRTQTALQDDEFMRKVFGATYDCLPKPAGRFVSEEAFIQFCLDRRRRLLGPEAGVEEK